MPDSPALRSTACSSTRRAAASGRSSRAPTSAGTCSRSRFEELAAIQTRILRAGAAATAPGGTLVYSVCTISRAEGPDVVERLLAEDPGLRLVSSRQLLPHVDSTDGFFIAVVCRT